MPLRRCPGGPVSGAVHGAGSGAVAPGSYRKPSSPDQVTRHRAGCRASPCRRAQCPTATAALRSAQQQSAPGPARVARRRRRRRGAGSCRHGIAEALDDRGGIPFGRCAAVAESPGPRRQVPGQEGEIPGFVLGGRRVAFGRDRRPARREPPVAGPIGESPRRRRRRRRAAPRHGAGRGTWSAPSRPIGAPAASRCRPEGIAFQVLDHPLGEVHRRSAVDPGGVRGAGAATARQISSCGDD